MDLKFTLPQGYSISTDRSKLNHQMIHQFLSKESYWSQNIPFEKVVSSIENSLCFGVYKGNEQVGFARIISDFTTVAYLGDVFILEAHRGQNLSKCLMQEIMNHPQLQGLRRWILLTLDAHKLYKQFGWKSIAIPERWMEKHTPNVYQINAL